MNINPTPYSDVNSIVQILLKEVQSVLGNRFIGMYLYGSLASGDFNPNSSDIDFLIVVDDVLPNDTITAIKEMHKRLSAMDIKWASKIEGSYVPKALLRNTKPPETPRPYINEGKFCIAHYGNEWILERYIIREKGIIVAGPSPKTLIDPIHPEDICQANLEVLNEWWVPMLRDSSRLKDDEYQVYAVLIMCRSLYSLEHGKIVSKKVAAQWVQEKFSGKWRKIVEAAINWKRGIKFDRFDETMSFIKFTIEFTKNI